ncbi:MULTISPECIES: phage tail protein [unclassified Pseudomonas]|uniref:phage tail protein n=1 Tax=unclassified Pseudomonas TaxID=196821 RepID=UPI001912E038|nr:MULTISPECIES: phage tail protein [unclassified Pseudomonas]MBK5373506.1 phage tail protein [Pseudomonas sp. TH43]MBK5512287.1 phage tail protein [Pseudomonas sp. TH15]
MSAILPNGSILEIAAIFSALKPVTAISNANPAVATAAAHGLADGDVIVVKSGWTRLNDKIARIAESDSGTFELEGINTTNTVVYTAGAGAGSVRAASGWAQISQITDSSSSGGEQQFTTFGFLEESDDRQLPTTKSPISMSITVADDPDLPYVAVVETADEDRAPRVLRLTLPNGSVIYYNAYVSITSTPTLSRNNIMTRTITLSLAARPTRYAAAV